MTLRQFKQYKYFILLPDDNFKFIWDIVTTLLLLLVFFVTPYRIAFTDEEETAWIVIDSIIDFLFLIDIVINFFSAYYNDKFILIDK